MAVTTITPQAMDRAGLAVAFAAANTANTGADGSTFANDGRTYLHCKNTNGSPITVKVQIPRLVDGQAVADKSIVVPATTGDVVAGPFPVEVYGESVRVTFSATPTNLTIAAVRL